MPVEAVVATGTAVGAMEITVSKFELLKELTATQGVVERKTTIPILSNYLFEAADGNRPGSEPANILQRQSKKRRLVYDSGTQTSRLRETAARRRHHY